MHARAHTRTPVHTHAHEHACERACSCARVRACAHAASPQLLSPSLAGCLFVRAASCGARVRSDAWAAVRGRVVGQPVASLSPAWAVLGSLCYKLPCLLASTCAARLDTGAGVSARGVLGGQLASGASQGSRRCAMLTLLCYVGRVGSTNNFMLCYQKRCLV